MKTVILAGGLGTRLREETEFKPKPMVEVGHRPIIWHIMKKYASHGFKKFVIASGYKGDVIKNYFMNFRSSSSDFTVILGKESHISYHDDLEEEGWEVTVSNTGLETQTGGRLYRLRRYLNQDIFFCTYGDGLADVDLKKLLDFHKKHGKLATVTAVRPLSRFGVLELDSSGRVNSFREKPQADSWINAGFFVFNREIFDFLDDSSVLEDEPLKILAENGELIAFKHQGFWQAMDTFREFKILNDLWNSNMAPWKSW